MVDGDRRGYLACLLGYGVGVSLGWGMGAMPAIAQITPDSTLRSESSQVQSGRVGGVPATRIGGGAMRGENLFHSFSEFNVNPGERVYFNNPAGIETILGRVTGRDVSDIQGTLGVAGGADLYLINPNGFVFGPNARLDIRGSFTASTADRLSFGNGQFFSAFTPRRPPLLTVSVPVGLQYNPGRGRASRLVSQGNLTVGQDLTLDAGFLDVSGRLQAGNDLTIRAQGTLLTSAVLRAGQDLNLQAQGLLQLGNRATSGGNLRLRGDGAINIVGGPGAALPWLSSGGHLSLFSDGVITTDARFESGGNFAVRRLTGEPGYWVNGQTATVNVGGDYVVGDYTGPSLQVNAGGDIRYGRVVINALNPAINPDHPVFALNAGGRIWGTNTISSTRNLPGLIVSLVSQGNLRVRNITTRGGPIGLVSRGGNITARDRLTTGSIVNDNPFLVEEYAGGTIALSARRDVDVSGAFMSSSSFSSSGDSRNGGNIILDAGRDLDASGSFSTSTSGLNSRGGTVISSRLKCA